ncbi:MAG: metallophosphoesterase family protein [Flammeovirgaceae bacterium]
MRLIFFFLLMVMFSRCKDQRRPHFVSEVYQQNTPWTYPPAPPRKGSFSFAIIGDLNSGERARVLEVAAEQIQLLRPEFVLSIGDLVEGGTEDTVELQKQYDHFDERMARAKSPVFHLGGNHDLTNPVMRKFWEHRYGSRYYHFIYQNVLFLMLDSEDYPEVRMWQIYRARAKALELIGSGKREEAEKTEYFQMPERTTGEISEAQSDYFEKVIADHPDVRWTFVLMHKPVWQRQEPKGLGRIEEALGTRDYTVLNGHLYKYSYQKRNGHDYVMVATTGGGQDPKSENAFDHITWVTMRLGEPLIVNFRLEGMLDKTGHVPLGGDSLCFQASKCI